MKFKTTLIKYYKLTKPGIVYGNTLSAVAGYLYGAAGSVNFISFYAMLLGIAMVMASACVYNNVMDRSIDEKMKRTRSRSVVTGEISVHSALVFATVLLIGGSFALAVGVNTLAFVVALFGLVAYVLFYGWAKRHTVHSTLIGTLSGATPPVIGYGAATGQLDGVAFLLFLLLVTWQMPHFYSIALSRREEYAAAGLPVLSVVAGVGAVKRQIVVYTILFIVTSVLLYIFGGASLLWALLMVLVGGYWLCLILGKISDVHTWARRQFMWSLNVLVVMCVALSVDSFWH